MALTVDEKSMFFTNIIHSCFSRTTPSKTVIMTSKDKPYITPLIKSLINSRWEAYRSKNFALYKHISTKVKKLLTISKINWAKNAEGGTKQLWKVVNDAIGAKSSRTSPLDFLVKQFPSALHAAEEMNERFVRMQVNRPAPRTVVDTPDWAPLITFESIFKLLASLSPSKSPGIDSIPSLIYKRAAPIIAAPLTHLINVSIQARRFPKNWKQSVIVPIPKTSPPSINELRPISLLPIPSKICEKAILNSGLRPLFCKAFGPLQFGGLKYSSTTAALICLHDLITSCLDQQQTLGVAVLAYDFSKAFDRLGHDAIICSLKENSFPPGFVSWIASYLSGRTQVVKISNITSSPLCITSGVPQGSLFGPFLFNTVVGSLQPQDPSTTIVK